MKKGGDIYLDISKEGYETDYVQLNKNLPYHLEEE
jgi:hypothetical protein